MNNYDYYYSRHLQRRWKSTIILVLLHSLLKQILLRHNMYLKKKWNNNKEKNGSNIFNW